MISRNWILVFFVIFICFNISIGNAHAAWSNDPSVNNAICTAAGTQSSPDITSDGSSGAIITWYDSRSDTNRDIYAQRVYANGALTTGMAAPTPYIAANRQEGLVNVSSATPVSITVGLFARRSQWTTCRLVACRQHSLGLAFS
jgi:hypothetical protein